MEKPTLAILGTGYVGLTTGVLTALAGMKTYLVDTNPARLESVRRGRSFFYEEGLDLLIAEGIRSGRLIPTSSYQDAVSVSDIVISAVGTPDTPDGSLNMQFVFAAAAEAARYMRPGSIFVQKSTVPVGTGVLVQQIFTDAALAVSYVSNPEFLREGTALRDSLWFERIVVGGEDAKACEAVTRVYRFIEQAHDELARVAHMRAPDHMPEHRYISVCLESAELIKVVSNAFLALKISFANSVAMLADTVDADILEVMDAVGADSRIGRKFLNAGRGYGGGCFPKDVSGLIAAGLHQGVDFSIMRAAQAVNEAMPGYIIEKLRHALNGSYEGRTVAILGLAFKAGTSDVRRSPGVAIVDLLHAAGVRVQAYDPHAAEEARDICAPSVIFATDIETALQGAAAVVVATDWPEFMSYPLRSYADRLGEKVFVDAMNCFDKAAARAAGLQYIGVGR